MWGRRRKRGARLPRQLALGRLEEAIARAEQREDGEPEAVPYNSPAPDVPAARPALLAEDVPVDNSACPVAEEDAGPPAPPRASRATHRGLHAPRFVRLK
jgi:hypothetical protein